MTIETVLTDKQIIDILERNRPDYDGLDKAISVSRAIEQAVLQSPEIQALRRDALIEVILEACSEWSQYVEVDSAPRTLREHIQLAIDHARQAEEQK